MLNRLAVLGFHPALLVCVVSCPQYSFPKADQMLWDWHTWPNPGDPWASFTWPGPEEPREGHMLGSSVGGAGKFTGTAGGRRCSWPGEGSNNCSLQSPAGLRPLSTCKETCPEGSKTPCNDGSYLSPGCTRDTSPMAKWLTRHWGPEAFKQQLCCQGALLPQKRRKSALDHFSQKYQLPLQVLTSDLLNYLWYKLLTNSVL